VRNDAFPFHVRSPFPPSYSYTSASLPSHRISFDKWHKHCSYALKSAQKLDDETLEKRKLSQQKHEAISERARAQAARLREDYNLHAIMDRCPHPGPFDVLRDATRKKLKVKVVLRHAGAVVFRSFMTRHPVVRRLTGHRGPPFSDDFCCFFCCYLV